MPGGGKQAALANGDKACGCPAGQARVRPSAGQAKRGPGGRVPSMTRHGVWMWGHVGSCAEHDTQQRRGRAAQQLLERAVLRTLQEPHAPVRGEARACEVGSASLGFEDCAAYASSAARTTTASRRWTGSLALSMAYEAGVGRPPAPAAGPDSSAKSPIARRHVSPRWDEVIVGSVVWCGTVCGWELTCGLIVRVCERVFRCFAK